VTPRRIGLACCLLLSATARAACQFDADFEIINPFDPTCGGVRLTYTENDDTGNHIALGYPVPVPVNSLTPVDGFRSYDSLHAQHQFLMTEHDTVAGEVVGHTASGREIWAYTLGDADSSTVDGRSEPAVLLNGGIHAREWQSPEVVTAVFELLVDRAADASVGQYLADNLNVVLVPVLNVDGFLQTQRYPDSATADVEQPRDGRMRRKNMSHPTRDTPVDEDLDTIDDNFYGVDVNRNSADGFGLNNGSSDLTTSLIYHGPTPASEPETLALQAAAELGPPGRLRLYEDIHSFGKVYLTPQTGNDRRDTLTIALRTQLRAVTGSSYGFGDDPVNGFIGTTADFFAYEYQVPAWTLELEPRNSAAEYGGTGVSHSGFVLPDSEIARVRDELALTQLLAFYLQAGPPRIQAVQISDRASGEVRYAASWESDSDQRTLDMSVDRALVPGTTYDLWLAFDRPMRWRNDQGVITGFPGQTGVTFPALTMEASDLDATLTLASDDADWLTTPGGAPDGYLRYGDDALRVPFTLPASFASAASQPMVLSVSATDFALAALDADPSTPVDWSSGHWTDYQDATGAAGDTGGADCTLQLFTADAVDASAPATIAACAASVPPPPPPPPPPGPSSDGGGGGTFDPGSLLLSLYALRKVARKRRRMGGH
jgi:hypothetical protein